MTSKEALELIYNNHQKREWQNQVLIEEAYKIIAEDLEVLDILKTNIVNCIGDTSGREYYKLILHKFNNEENFEKVNKWLKK